MRMLKPISNRERKLWRPSVHEAGHAIVAVRYGGRSGSVSIGRLDGSLGRCSIHVAPVDDDAELARRLTVLFAAGQVAERIAAKGFPLYPQDIPPLQVNRHPEAATRCDQDDDALVYSTSRLAQIGPMSETELATRARAFVVRCACDAFALLEADEIALRTLALELISDEVVSAARVLQILEEQDARRSTPVRRTA